MARRDREAAADVLREQRGREALDRRGLGCLGFGDRLTPDELRSMYLMVKYAMATAPDDQVPCMLPGMLWLDMLFDAGASMLPGNEFEKHHKNLPVLKQAR